MSARDRRISKSLRQALKWHALLDRPAQSSLDRKASDEGKLVAPLPTYITRAFEAFNLNPKKSGDWEAIVWELAPILFPDPNKRRGRGRIWNVERLRQLLLDFQKLKNNFPNLSDGAICEKIINHPKIGSPYREQNQLPQTLRRKLPAARATLRTVSKQ